MRRILFQRPLHQILFQPQSAILCDEEGRLLADYTGRAEHMQESYDHISAKLEIPGRILGKINESQHGDYRQYYDSLLPDGVSGIYHRDLELFGQEF